MLIYNNFGPQHSHSGPRTGFRQPKGWIVQLSQSMEILQPSERFTIVQQLNSHVKRLISAMTEASLPSSKYTMISNLDGIHCYVPLIIKSQMARFTKLLCGDSCTHFKLLHLHSFLFICLFIFYFVAWNSNDNDTPLYKKVQNPNIVKKFWPLADLQQNKRSTTGVPHLS